MKFTAAAVAAFVAGASAHYGSYSNETVVYTTEVVTAYTTYCPGPTTIAHGTKTYTVTEATTLTITDCPCTVTKPVYSSSVVNCPSSTPAPSVPAGPYPNATAPAPAPPVYSSSAVVIPSSPVVSSPPIATGAATKVSAAGLAAAFGLLAFVF